MPKQKSAESKPWWQFGHVWMVISGPAIVVAAGFVTLYLALQSPNEIVSDHEIEVAGSGVQKEIPGGMAPAMQARNHAATGVVPVSK